MSLLFNQEEARASQEQQGTAGIKVFVDLYHNGRGSAQLWLYSFDQNLGFATINLSDYTSLFPYRLLV